MKTLQSFPILPLVSFDRNYLEQLNRQLTLLLSDSNQQLNDLSYGRIAALPALTAPPTTGSWQQGDEVRNSEPTEAGTAGSKYIIRGWICTAAGTPGTWKESRVLTGA